MEIPQRTSDHDPVTIVIAEDDTSLAEMLSITLRLEGFRVTIATDGTTALRLTRDLRPRVVLLDISMPAMDGVEVCRALRTGSAAAGPAVIMLSGATSEEDQNRCLDAGADLFLAKPFETTDLIVSIRALLRRSHRSDASTPRTGPPADVRTGKGSPIQTRDGEAMAIFEVRIDGITGCGERYGEARRDQVIRLASRILGAVAGVGPPVLVGPHGDMGFLLVTREGGAPDVCALAVDTFAACVVGLFDRDDGRGGSLAMSMSPWSPGGDTPLPEEDALGAPRARAALGGARVFDTKGRPLRSAILRAVTPLRRAVTPLRRAVTPLRRADLTQ